MNSKRLHVMKTGTSYKGVDHRLDWADYFVLIVIDGEFEY